ncbi:MAG: prepilin-type N-terminal cleavage/methylation domain-containing protein [Planctomycetes bacterium]|nr:prepilin-type N-terminal cleavage/methylation domain-containing protein [Planctomycetota bacterium]
MTRTHASGFTLIEMMIAIALGMMVVYTAIAGFRVASQTITAAKRLSLENSLLRSGYFEAQRQLDFWTNLDDPTALDTERPLKRTGNPADSSIGALNSRDYSMKRGLPFTPMRALQSEGVWPKSPGVPRFADPKTVNGARVGTIMPRDLSFYPPPTSANSNDALEADTGFDPSYSWSPHDPRTWIRVDLSGKERNWVQQQYVRNKDANNKDVTDPLYPDKYVHPDFPEHFPLVYNGRYILFSNPENSGAALPTFRIIPDPNKSPLLLDGAMADMNNKMVEITYSGYPTAGTHTWYPHQMSRLINAMGYAALCEYLPPNSLYSWYTLVSTRGDRTEGAWFNKFGMHHDFEFCNDNGGQKSARGIWRQTYPSSYGYINPRAPNDFNVYPAPDPPSPVATDKNLRQRFYARYKSDNDTTDPNGGNAKQLNWFITRTGLQEPLMVERPQNWPEVKVSVARFIKSAHHVAVAKISRFSPMTGELIELSWTGLGTTLRGARQQRLPTTGWAHWDNDPGVTNDPTLDSP